MKVSHPLAVTVPASGVYFAESVHAHDFEMTPRADSYRKLLYVLRGRVRYEELGRAPLVAVAGTLLIVPAGTRHKLVDEETSTLLLLCVAEGFWREVSDLREAWRRGLARNRRQAWVSGPQRAQLEATWRRALVERAQQRPAAEAALRALALLVFVQLARLPEKAAGDATAESGARRVALVAREIEETFFERWTLDGAAARAGMSRRHFSAQFREATGRTFWEHLTEVRLAQAAQLLERGEHSIAGVIFACGFGDVSQFYRLFRTRHGQAPRAWVEHCRREKNGGHG